jgi:phage anti-repressor protein
MLNLQEFLKKYSSISNKFIDDFFSLYTINSDEGDLIINFDNLVNWLNMRKDNLKKTLITSYIKNIDYKIKKIKSNTAGKPKEEILITSNCCKRLCMMSRTEKAEEVRTYFIEIEKLMNKYKNYIIEALDKRINILENNQKPIPNNKNGIIYVLKTNYDIVDLYKIGKTKNFKNRLQTHQISHPEKLDIAYVYETDMIDQVESCLKNLLKTKGYRKRKEFYEIDIDILKTLIKMCECMTLSIRRKTKDIKNEECKYILMLFKNSLDKEEKLLGKPKMKK